VVNKLFCCKIKIFSLLLKLKCLLLVPGVIHYEGAEIQLLDLPGIIEGAAQGKGRGRQVIAVARTADMVLMMLDATKGEIQR
jgi:ribosome-interacting GTPase 1